MSVQGDVGLQGARLPSRKLHRPGHAEAAAALPLASRLLQQLVCKDSPLTDAHLPPPLLSPLSPCCSACAQRVRNDCEKKCKDDLKPLCVSHYQTNCKPSWWGNPDIQGGRCMSLVGAERVRMVFPNECKYKCIAGKPKSVRSWTGGQSIWGHLARH